MAVVVGTLFPVIRSPGLGDHFSDFLSAPTWVDVVQLTANTAANYTLAAGANIFRLTPTVIPTYGNFNGAAVVPAAGVVNGTASFPIGGQTYLIRPAGLTTLSLICGTAGFVTIEAWN
jgi:hypothetical protein